ncbi:LOW QUALITY PROTEIN: Zinc finger protein 618, partial [Frankliniella fusca]
MVVEYCSAHAYNIVYTHAMTVAPKDFQSLPSSADSLAVKVEQIVGDLRKLRNRKLGKGVITATKLVFPKTFTRISCVTFVSDNFVKIRDVLKKGKCGEACNMLEGLHLGDLHSLKVFLHDLEKIVGRIGHTSGSVYPGLLDLCQVKETDTDFQQELRAHLIANKHLHVLKVLHLKVTYMKSTGHNSELRSTLKQYMEVRWNSFHRMLESIQKVFRELEAFFERKNHGKEGDDRNTKLEAIDKELLDELIDLFIPLKGACEHVQAKYSVAAQLPLVTYYRLRLAYSPNPNDSEAIRELRNRLYCELQNVIKLTEANKVAAFLDPTFRNFRNMLTEDEKAEVHGWVRNQLDKIDNLNPNHPDPDEPDADAADTAPAMPPAKKTKIDPYAVFPALSTRDELKAYLEEPLGEYDMTNPKPLAWWQQRADKFPRLSRLARRYLINPASSAEIERTFSDAGCILNKRRTNLELNVVDDLLFLHSNFREKLQRKMNNFRLRSSVVGN